MDSLFLDGPLPRIPPNTRGAGVDDLSARIASYELAFRMQSAVPEAVEVTKETTATRDLYAVDDPVHIHDVHATVLKLLGLDHERLTFLFQGRRQRLTDVGGEEQFAERLLG